MRELIRIKAVVESMYNDINICDKTKLRNYADARKIYYYIANNYTNYKRESIGSHINRVHSTITTGIKSCENLMETDLEFRKKLLICMNKCEKVLLKKNLSNKEKLDLIFKKLSKTQQEKVYFTAYKMYAFNQKKILYV